MFAAILLAVLPFAPSFGAPCVCFEIKHAGAHALPDDPLGKPAWTAERLVEETLRAVRATDDVFVRTETLRTGLRALTSKDDQASTDARARIFKGLEEDLKIATENSVLSRATVECTGDLPAVREKLIALPGVGRVDRTPVKGTLIVWFDAKQVGPKLLQETASASAMPAIEPPNDRARSVAAITLAFAGQSSRQLGGEVAFDPRAMARQAVNLAPKDPRVLLIAAMVWFDEDANTTAMYLRDALRQAGKDEYVTENIERIFTHFFDAKTLDELRAKLDKRLERG